MLVYVSSATTLELLIEYRTGTNYKSDGAWSTFGTYSVAGWSGWNDIPLILGTLGGGSTQTSNNWQLRLTFTVRTKSASYPKTASVLGIRIYGANYWATPSTFATTGHMYTFDMSKNVFFPAAIYEAGTALSSKYAALSHNHDNTYLKVPAVAPTTPGMILGLDAAYDPYWYNPSDIWRPLGTGATDAAAGNHAHGNVTNTGTIASTAVTSATGVLVYDSNNKIQRATAANARSIIGAGTYSKPSGGIPASDLASGVIPSVSNSTITIK
jgi:hypothetical protein